MLHIDLPSRPTSRRWRPIARRPRCRSTSDDAADAGHRRRPDRAQEPARSAVAELEAADAEAADLADRAGGRRARRGRRLLGRAGAQPGDLRRRPTASAPSACRTGSPTIVEVADRFHLKPLLRAVTFPHNAYVLAIGMGAVRLIEVDADLPPCEVKVPGLPKDMASALGRRSHAERTGPGRSGEQTSEHALLTRYARAVDQALRPVLTGHERPLIVAAAEPLASVYRAVSSYPAHRRRGDRRQLRPHARPRAGRGGARRARRRLRRRGRASCGALRPARAAGPGGRRRRAGGAGGDLRRGRHADRRHGRGRAGTVDDETGAVTFGAPGKAEPTASSTRSPGARCWPQRPCRLGARAHVPGGGDLAAILRYAV